MKNDLICLTASTLRQYVIGLSLAAGALLAADLAIAQAPTGKPATDGATAAGVNEGKAGRASRQATAAKPIWSELSTAQRDALRPLADHWDALSASQKRKWIAVSKNYRELPPAEQSLLHARMDDWVMLSPQQRRTARLNFAETKRMSSREKQQKWEAYQALSPDARHKLSEAAPTPLPGAAVAVRPVPKQKLATVPMTEPNASARPKLAAPSQIDPHTLLPQRVEAERGSGAAPIQPASRP